MQKCKKFYMVLTVLKCHLDLSSHADQEMVKIQSWQEGLGEDLCQAQLQRLKRHHEGEGDKEESGGGTWQRAYASVGQYKRFQ